MAGMKTGRSGWCMRRDWVYDQTYCGQCTYLKCKCPCHQTAESTTITRTLEIMQEIDEEGI